MTPLPPEPHAVARLRRERLAASTKPYVARGGSRERCDGCRLPPGHCLCAWRPRTACGAGMCLLLGDIEALKPSNTGWLIADVVPDTFAFAWSRTRLDPALPALLADPRWQPYLVFPGEFVAPERVLTRLPPPPAPAPAGAPPGPRPLFVLLDGTWSEARKMFRKTPCLDRLPVLSLQPGQASRYRLRRSQRDDHFCTAEVAALCLDLAGEPVAAERLDAWFDLFSLHYLSARRNLPPPAETEAHARLRALLAAPGAAVP